MDITEIIKKKFCCWVGPPEKARTKLTMLFGIKALFVLLAFIISCIAASYLKSSGTIGGAAGFAAMWTSLVLIVTNVAVVVFRRHSLFPISYGIYIGMLFILTNQMLILFAIFADFANIVSPQQTAQVVATERAMAAFSFFLFLLYLIVTLITFAYRDDLVKGDAPDDEKDAEGQQDPDDEEENQEQD